MTSFIKKNASKNQQCLTWRKIYCSTECYYLDFYEVKIKRFKEDQFYQLRLKALLFYMRHHFIQFNIYSYFSNQNPCRKMSNKNNRNNAHNSQLYQKLLEDQHYLSHQQPQQKEENDLPNDKVQMVIQFGGNNSASLMVGPEDDPSTLAKCFCFKYNIDPRIITTLASNIRNLQFNAFSAHNQRDLGYKIQKNQNNFDDKQNHNQLNYISKQQKSNEKSFESTKIRMSRNKTGQSSQNDSIILSNSHNIAGAGGNNTNRYNVFERLYQDSRKKNMKGAQLINTTKKNESKISLNASHINNRSLNESSIQSCLQIYDKNTKLKEETQRNNERLHELKVQKEIQECKFKPEINHLSSLIAGKLRQLNQSSIISRTSNDRQMTKIKQYLLKREQQQMKQCTFNPRIITKISSQSSTTNPTQRFLQLHQDYKLRETKKLVMSKEKNKENQQEHHPAINRISNIIIKKNFYERLEQDTKKRVVKQQSQQKLREKSTRRNPSTGRAPANRTLGEKTIGQYLYEKAKNSRALPTKQPPKVVVDQNSSKIYHQSKKLAFKYLFELLDNDQDGLISSTRINISALSQQILRLLAPLLSEMEQVEVELNQQQFSLAFDKLFATFSVGQKNLILKFYKNKGVNSRFSQQSSFQPTLNEKSLMIARQLCNQDGDIYDLSIMRMKQKQNKLNRLRAERMLQQYSQCTFHPRLHY